MNRSSLLTSSASRRLLRPIADLIDQRIARRLRSSAELEAVEREKLWHAIELMKSKQLTVDLLLDDRGRGISRMVGSDALNRLQSEVAELAGNQQAAVRNVASA